MRALYIIAPSILQLVVQTFKIVLEEKFGMLRHYVIKSVTLFPRVVYEVVASLPS